MPRPVAHHHDSVARRPARQRRSSRMERITMPTRCGTRTSRLGCVANQPDTSRLAESRLGYHTRPAVGPDGERHRRLSHLSAGFGLVRMRMGTVVPLN